MNGLLRLVIVYSNKIIKGYSVAQGRYSTKESKIRHLVLICKLN